MSQQSTSKLVSLITLMLLLLSGCTPLPWNRAAVVPPTGLPPTPTPTATATPTSAPEVQVHTLSQAEAAQERQTLLDQLDLNAPSAPLRVVRHQTAECSFEIPPGWEIFDLAGEGFVLQRQGSEVFQGIFSDQPYLYVGSAPWPAGRPLDPDALIPIRRSLAGIEAVAEPLALDLAGRRGVGQFVSGRIGSADQPRPYRAFLLAVPNPRQTQVAHMLFWGLERNWPTDARELALVLESILWN